MSYGQQYPPPRALLGTAGGDLTGAFPNPELADVGTPGTYTKVTTDSKGRVISGSGLLLIGDLPENVNLYPQGPLPDPAEMEVLVDTSDVGGVADGDPMTTWPNQGTAGSAKDPTNAGGGVRGIYRAADIDDGLPYIEMDGIDDYFRVLSMPVYTGGALTFFLVIRAGVWTNNARILSLADPGTQDGATTGSVIYQELSGNGGVLRRGSVNRSVNNAAGAGGGFYDAQFTWQVLAVRYGLVPTAGGGTRAVCTMMQNGRVVSFDQGASSLTAFNFESLFLGAGNASGDGSTPDNFWRGDFRHFSYVPSSLSIPRMRDCCRLLARQHGVPVLD